MSFRSRRVFRIKRAGRSPLETFPLETPPSPLALPLNALHTCRARSSDAVGARTRIRSGRYCSKAFRSSEEKSRVKRTIGPFETKTAVPLLAAMDTPEERRSGGDVINAECE